MPAPITATGRGVEVMADVLSGVGRDAGGPGARPADQGWGGNRSWRRSAAGGGSRGMRRRGQIGRASCREGGERSEAGAARKRGAEAREGNGSRDSRADSGERRA